MQTRQLNLMYPSSFPTVGRDRQMASFVSLRLASGAGATCMVAGGAGGGEKGARPDDAVLGGLNADPETVQGLRGGVFSARTGHEHGTIIAPCLRSDAFRGNH